MDIEYSMSKSDQFEDESSGFEDDTSELDPFEYESSSFEEKLTAVLAKDMLTDSDKSYLKRMQYELEERSANLEKEMIAANNKELTIDQTLMARYKNVNVLLIRIVDKLTEAGDLAAKNFDFDKKPVDLNQAELDKPIIDFNPPPDVWYVKTVESKPQKKTIEKKESKNKISWQEWRKWRPIERNVRLEPPADYQFIKKVTEKPETFDKRFWSILKFPRFLQDHFYLLWAKDKKMMPLKRTFENLLRNIVKAEGKVKKFLRNETPFEYLVYDTPRNNTEKFEKIKYLRSRLIISEIMYLYSLCLRNREVSSILKHESKPDELLDEEALLIYEEFLPMKDKADALNYSIREEKEDCKELREWIKDLKWKSNSNRDKVTKIRNNLINNCAEYFEKNYEILKIKVDLYRDYVKSREERMKQFERDLEILKDNVKKELRIYKKYMKIYKF